MHTEAAPSGSGRVRSRAFFRALMDQKFVVVALLALGLGWGAMVAPFGWFPGVERATVPVDAIPDIGENQQIVFTEWAGRSPQDVEDQVTYPLTAALQGIPRVKTIRSTSMFGFSMVYLIFEEGAEFYWTRARIAEKLASLPPGTLPDDASPQLGPDATALGQIFWYTLEAQDEEGRVVAAFDPDELRAIQDFQVRYALAAAEGVAEVASIGGFVREYQVDVDPDALRAWGLGLEEVVAAVRSSHAEVGAQTSEINGVEYSIRGIGFVRSVEDLEEALVAWVEGTPVRLRDVAQVGVGPGQRRGALTRSGAEAVGAVVTARYGANPREVIANVQERIAQVAPSLPTRELEDGRVAQVRIVPFYDRTELIDRTVGTLRAALWQQILITILVVLVLLMHLRAGLLIAALLPAAVVLAFVAMFHTGVDANVVALAGIAIAIGTMVDIGIIITENIVQRLERAPAQDDPRDTIADAVAEVAGAVWTALATTVISFLPVFAMEGQEGRLFGPLAWTKTFALVASLVVALLAIPVLAWLLFGAGWRVRRMARELGLPAWAGGAPVGARAGGHGRQSGAAWAGPGAGEPSGARLRGLALRVPALALAAAVAVALTWAWMPLGAGAGEAANLLFVALLVGGLLGGVHLFLHLYRPLLLWVLGHKLLFMTLPAMLVLAGLTTWLGFGSLFSWLPDRMHRSEVGQWLHHEVQGMSREFMPQLDEGAFLYMPTTMPHGSIGEIVAMTRELDLLFESVPEVAWSVGKLGRAESPLDPAPLSMLETVIEIVPEYRQDADGRRLRYAVDGEGRFVRDDAGELIEDRRGRPLRQWRPHIRSPQDIWDELVAVADVAGLTSAPLLQPISTRIVMLQSGIRAPMAVRLQGADLGDLAAAGMAIQAHLREHPMVNTAAVNADRPVGTPYLEIHPRREALAQYGIPMARFQETVEVAIGGRMLLQTVEGRERFPVRVRYPRELRMEPHEMERVLVTAGDGAAIPLGDVADIRWVRGPEMIRSENTQLVTFVMFDRAAGVGEVQAVEAVRDSLLAAMERGELQLAEGVSWSFAGAWENSVRAEQRLRILMPVVALIILLLLFLQFRSLLVSLIIFSGVAVAFSGGFLLLWAWGQPWFLDATLLGADLREVFRVGPMALSVAVWVGFIALFGIATDDGVVMSTYLQQRFEEAPPRGVEEIRARVLEAGERRVRPCLMTTATTILALLPVLTSYGTGADVMRPMALPAVGGMALALITLFVVPTLWCMVHETRHHLRSRLRPSGVSAAPRGDAFAHPLTGPDGGHDSMDPGRTT